jgi:hypothetical protein
MTVTIEFCGPDEFALVSDNLTKRIKLAAKLKRVRSSAKYKNAALADKLAMIRPIEQAIRETQAAADRPGIEDSAARRQIAEDHIAAEDRFTARFRV